MTANLYSLESEVREQADLVIETAAANIIRITDPADARNTALLIYNLGISQGRLEGALAALSPEST